MKRMIVVGSIPVVGVLLALSLALYQLSWERNHPEDRTPMATRLELPWAR